MWQSTPASRACAAGIILRDGEPAQALPAAALSTSPLDQHPPPKACPCVRLAIGSTSSWDLPRHHVSGAASATPPVPPPLRPVDMHDNILHTPGHRSQVQPDHENTQGSPAGTGTGQAAGTWGCGVDLSQQGVSTVVGCSNKLTSHSACGTQHTPACTTSHNASMQVDHMQHSDTTQMNDPWHAGMRSLPGTINGQAAEVPGGVVWTSVSGACHPVSPHGEQAILPAAHTPSPPAPPPCAMSPTSPPAQINHCNRGTTRT